LLKGIYYADRFFVGPIARPFDDVDILVRQEQLTTAISALRSDGFSLRDHRPLLEFAMRRFEHSVELKRGNAKLDLHWRLRNRPSYRLDAERIWQSRQDLKLASGTYNVLSDEYAVTMSILESASSIEQGGFRFKVLLDLFRMLETVHLHINWQKFFENRQRENILSISVNVLNMVIELFECKSRFYRLGDAIDRYEYLKVLLSRDEIIDILQAPRPSPQNRIWFMQCYNGNTKIYIGWTVLSFLFRRRISRVLPSALSIWYIFSSLFQTFRDRSEQ